MKKFKFVGSICVFDTIIAKCWTGETIAISEKKAMSNLLYRAKDQMGYLPSAKLRLDGQLTEVKI